MYKLLIALLPRCGAGVRIQNQTLKLHGEEKQNENKPLNTGEKFAR